MVTLFEMQAFGASHLARLPGHANVRLSHMVKRSYAASAGDDAWDMSSEEGENGEWDRDDLQEDKSPQFLEAAEKITAFLKTKYMTTDKLPANEFCMCCHWLSILGASVADPYAMKTGGNTSNYQRHLDLVQARTLNSVILM